ncbi:lactococcin 972 family bacteriocin [Paenarthrobacter aurescens]|uniref:lactococcin 972 family bacteriocin n=1 Tax=Paenarthrobacter aurescens TaxID=43663 RepID=UPI0034D346C7
MVSPDAGGNHWYWFIQILEDAFGVLKKWRSDTALPPASSWLRGICGRIFWKLEPGGSTKNIRRSVAGGILALALSAAGGAAAVASTVYPNEGGTWNYGVSGGVHLYSDYFNQVRCHASSTQNDWGYSSSGEMAANTWANNSQPTTAFQNNRAYYRVC